MSTTSSSTYNTLSTNRNTNQSPVKGRVLFAIFDRVNNISRSTQKLIPIDNSILSVFFSLGLVVDEENKMRVLLDTDSPMNSENIIYHMRVISECQEMVGQFIQCGANTGYDVVQLLVALNLDSSQQSISHRKMTAVIRYRTPYLINKRYPLFIYFALGNDVSFRCVLGFLSCQPWVDLLI